MSFQNYRTKIFVFVVLVEFLCCGNSFGQGKIYWSNFTHPYRLIQRSDLNGTHIEALVTNLSYSVLDIVVDDRNDKMYWLNPASDTIHRANMDGTNEEVIINGVDAWDIDLDPVENKLYWSYRRIGKIQKSNLDGSEIEDWVTGINPSAVLSIDSIDRNLFWSDSPHIHKTNLIDNIDDIILDLSFYSTLVIESLHYNPSDVSVRGSASCYFFLGGYSGIIVIFRRWSWLIGRAVKGFAETGVCFGRGFWRLTRPAG